MKTSTNVSLNDALMAGPVLQQDLFDIVLRFRLHMYAMTADVAKMYRQILVEKSDRHFQRIVWRDAPDKSLKHFVLNTVTYGMVHSSFLATRVLKVLSTDCAMLYPEASRAIAQDFYMDDFLSGADSVTNAEVLYKSVYKILESGGMYLRKWCSNSEDLRQIFSNSSAESHYSLDLSPDETTSSLGLAWSPTLDELMFQNKHRVSRATKTKRELLSTLNSVFVPMGFLGPVLIRGKVFLQ
jgi:Pao retrotransposon peptidase